MTKTMISTSILAATALTTQAAIIIGGSTLDGNFEQGVGGNPSPGGWVSTGTSANNAQILNDVTVISGYCATLGLDNTGSYAFGRDTGYLITTGDQFDGGFSWRDKYGWGAADGSVEMFLFYTDDNLITGTRTLIATWASGPVTVTDTTETETFGLTTAYAGPAAKTLFVSIETNSVNLDSFARADEILLNVTPVPEPSGAAFLGLGGLALIFRRRK